jgi:hypothetical protein
MRRIVPCLVALLLPLAACDKETKPLRPSDRNFAPEILSIRVSVPRVLAGEEVSVVCSAQDRDDDFLGYSWVATAGTFPRGSVLASVGWRTPLVHETQTLTVTVTDFRDTVTASLPVDLLVVAPPENLNFVNGSTLVDLTWDRSQDETKEGWSGYMVYAAPRDLAGLSPDSIAGYQLHATPLPRLQFRASSLTPGVRTYFQVRSRRAYEGIVEISEDGPVVETASRPDGIGSEPVFEVRSRRGAKGIHLPGGTVELMDPSQVERIDLYLGTANLEDESGSLRLKSPSRLAYLDARWAQRVTGIQVVGQDWGLPVPPEDGYVEEAPIVVGQVYALRTADGHYAKLRVAETTGAPPERRIEFQWAWQPIPGYPRF